MKRKILKISANILVVILFVIGICIFIYPLISGYVSDKNSETVIQNFENTKKSVQGDIKLEGENYYDLYKEMESYNNKIFKDGQKGLCDAWSYEQTSVDLSEFGLYDGVVGILRVPRMNDLKMPIYLGASYNNMSMGAAQLGQTSMPIGGKNTNCVIAGHRGWNGAKYFLDIEQMQIGDMVYIDNLWSTLSYEVSDIKIIQPNDIDEILIQEDKDMVTLITCHPYWASTYRYAVFCTRTSSNASEYQQGGAENIQDEQTVNNIEVINDDALSGEVSSDFESSHIRIIAEKLSFIVVPVVLIILAVILHLKRLR